MHFFLIELPRNIQLGTYPLEQTHTILSMVKGSLKLTYFLEPFVAPKLKLS